MIANQRFSLPIKKTAVLRLIFQFSIDTKNWTLCLNENQGKLIEWHDKGGEVIKEEKMNRDTW